MSEDRIAELETRVAELEARLRQLEQEALTKEVWLRIWQRVGQRAQASEPARSEPTDPI